MKWEVKGKEKNGSNFDGRRAQKQQHPTSTFACCAKALTRVV
jgi:hypothetical protein